MADEDSPFWTSHMSKFGGLCQITTGESLDEFIDEINEFSSENPGDVIVLWSQVTSGPSPGTRKS